MVVLGGYSTNCSPTQEQAMVVIELIDPTIDPTDPNAPDSVILDANGQKKCYNFGILESIYLEMGQGLMVVELPNTPNGIAVPTFTSGSSITLETYDTLTSFTELIPHLAKLKEFKVFVNPNNVGNLNVITHLRIFIGGTEYVLYPEDMYGRTTGVLKNVKVRVSARDGIGRVSYQIKFDIGKAFNELTVVTT